MGRQRFGNSMHNYVECYQEGKAGWRGSVILGWWWRGSIFRLSIQGGPFWGGGQWTDGEEAVLWAGAQAGGGEQCFRQVEEQVQRPLWGNKHGRIVCEEVEGEVRVQSKWSLVGWSGNLEIIFIAMSSHWRDSRKRVKGLNQVFRGPKPGS